ncbi:hypothetical protein D3C81_2248060 [compost metagenome]
MMEELAHEQEPQEEDIRAAGGSGHDRGGGIIRLQRRQIGRQCGLKKQWRSK